MGPLLLNVFVNDTDEGIDCILSKFSHNTKQSGVVDMPEAWDATQRGLGKPKEFVHENLIKFNQAKGKVLHLVQGNSGINGARDMEGSRAALPRRTSGYCWTRGWA